MQTLTSKAIRHYLRNALAAKCDLLDCSVRPLRGGLDSEGVWRMRARFSAPGLRTRSLDCVVKRVMASRAREAAIYKQILGPDLPAASPTLLDMQEAEGSCHIFLQTVHPSSRWPWRDTSLSASVLKALAGLHQMTPPCAATQGWFLDWDYASELQGRAAELLRVVESTSRKHLPLCLRGQLPALRRMVSAWPELRRQLMESGPWGSRFIHGDVHPGNVLVEKTATGFRPVFIDWGRSRMGSPLEDVSSWLQWLGYWEPEARRRHDTLLTTYLQASGQPGQLTRELRDAYWLAAASNVLAGAILYHFSVAADQQLTSRRREGALKALADCCRVIRRAHASWAGSL